MGKRQIVHKMNFTKPNMHEQRQKLAELKEKEHLTQEEYNAQKRKLLS